MPFIPHTDQEIDEMLEAIGIKDTDALFAEIPSHLRVSGLEGIPEGMTEMDVSRLMHQRAAENKQAVCFLGAGAYEHHIPAAVWQLTTRGEYYTAYTPYQAEASQGTLQLTYEYQSMMTALTDMDVSNASLYDGASALAEAILMAVRGNRKSKSRKIVIPRTVHPAYRKTANTIVGGQNIELVEVDYNRASGTVSLDAIKQAAGDDVTAVVIQHPSFFGTLEDVDAITDWAHQNNALMIAITNPLSIAILKPPGQWGERGADIACGDGQPLGAPLSSGGPYYGFLCCSQKLVRQMPGRIVGRTTDVNGTRGFVLTLQAREQHIRRSKATSNICTNQGLVVTASTIHMAILGPRGLEHTAAACHANTRALVEQLNAIDGVETAFSSPIFHESVLLLDRPADQVLEALAERDILGGYDLAADYPELGNAILVCATELRTEEDIMAYRSALQAILDVEIRHKEIA
ncbi:MAG: aminomethyl-transferring glycine dehydrogenase subunit GcvPA [Gammaproteobacteria bacterium]|nr:aminomethyl-transferring glycine dehydrogenase subunit GcvPA [Gammaproteobacteria bacterium]